MPKRSNDFQRLVYFLKNHNYSEYEVEESRELIDIDTGRKREVDIVIEWVHEYSTIISIECIDWKNKKAGSPWVEQMIKKHEKLQTDKLILVSKSGFTAPALIKAQKANVLTETYQDFQDLGTSEFFSKLKNLRLKFVTPTINSVSIIVRSTKGEFSEIEDVNRKTSIFTQEGEEISDIAKFVSAMINDKIVVNKILREGTIDHKYFTIEWAVNKKYRSNYFIQHSTSKQLFELIVVRVIGDPNIEDYDAKQSSGKIGLSEFVTGEVTREDEKISFMISSAKDIVTLKISEKR